MDNDYSQNSFGRTTKYSGTNGTNYKTSMRKPYYDMNNTTYNIPRHSSISSNETTFCLHCDTLRPCTCEAKEPFSFLATYLPPPNKYSLPTRHRQSSPYYYRKSSPVRHIKMERMLSGDSYSKDDKTPKCFTCNSSLVAPRCPCGQPTYCCKCEYVNTCACGEYKKICCLKCNSFLVPPKCTCGKPTYCIQCEEVTPCEECTNDEDNTGLPKCFTCACTLVPPKCICGKPMYCVQCEEISPCKCSQSKNQPKCPECSYVLTPPRCGCGQPTYCWHCEEISPCKRCTKSSYCNIGEPNQSQCIVLNPSFEKKVSIQTQATYIPSQPSNQAKPIHCKERECKCKSKSKSQKRQYFQITYGSLRNLTKPQGNTKVIVKRIKSPVKKSKKLCRT